MDNMVAYLLPPLVQTAFCMVLIYIVLKGHIRSSVHQGFAFYLLGLAAWGLVIFAMRASPDLDQAYFWERFLLPLAPIISVVLYRFATMYSGIKIKQWLQLALWGICVLFIPLAFTRLGFVGMQLKPYGYAPIFGPVGVLWMLFSYTVLIMALTIFIRMYQTTSDARQRNRLLYIVIGMVFALLGGLFDFLPLVGLPLYPGLIIGNIIFCSFTSVAILKYNLFDIHVILRKSAAYLLATIFIGIPFVAIVLVVPSIFMGRFLPVWQYILLALLLALLVPPIWRVAQVQVDKWFYRDRYNYLKELQTFSRTAQSVAEPSEIGQTAVRLISGALHTPGVYLLQPAPSGKHFIVTFQSDEADICSRNILFYANSALINWMKRSDSELFCRDIDVIPQLVALSAKERGYLSSIGAELIVPLKMRAGELSGCIIMGRKVSGQPYTQEDIQVVRTISVQVVTSIENARLYNDALQARKNIEMWLNCMSDCVFIVDSNRRIQFRNRAADIQFGNAKTQTCWCVMGRERPCDSCPIESYFSGKMKNGVQFGVNIGDTEFDVVTAPFLNQDGSLSIIEVFRDITERKRGEEILRQSEDRYRSLVDNAAEGISVVQDDVIKFANRKLAEITGYSVDEMNFMPTEKFIHPEDLDGVRRYHVQRMKGGKVPSNFRLRIIDKEGNVRWMERNVAPINWGDKPASLVFDTDITELKMAEDEKRLLGQKAHVTSRLASVGEMTAGVAHEINNPLTAVIGYTQLLMDRKDTPEDVRPDLAAINDGAQRVSGIVKRLLAFSRQTKPERRLVDTNELVESTLALRAYHLRVNNIETVTMLAPDLPKTIADPGQIQQVLLNLIVNAEMEMELAHGKGKLTITTKKSDNTIKICVKDNGPGIKPEIMDRMFDPFFTTRDVGQGTGLGLSLCYGIIAEHDGKIYAESKPGKGATFIVELPIVNKAELPGLAEPVVEEPKKVVKAKILVVDDEQVIRNLVERVLTDEGYEIDTVDNADDALKTIEGKRYNLILLDIKMPGIDGVELYRRIERIAKSLAQRVVFITGDIMAVDTEKFLSETKVAHIDKPFNAEQLRREVKRALSGGR
jgi:PAS domain S-box-containing protein